MKSDAKSPMKSVLYASASPVVKMSENSAQLVSRSYCGYYAAYENARKAGGQVKLKGSLPVFGENMCSSKFEFRWFPKFRYSCDQTHSIFPM
jgi:hypothetical protein